MKTTKEERESFKKHISIKMKDNTENAGLLSDYIEMKLIEDIEELEAKLKIAKEAFEEVIKFMETGKHKGELWPGIVCILKGVLEKIDDNRY